MASPTLSEGQAYAVIGPEAPAVLSLLTTPDEVARIQPGGLVDLLKKRPVRALILSADRAGGDAASDVETAHDANIPVRLLKRHVTVAAILDNIRLLADLTDNRQIGSWWIYHIADGVARIKDQVRGLPIVRVLVLTPEGYTQGQGAFITELIALAGGINVAAEAGIPEARQVGDTQIRNFAPEVVLLLGWNSSSTAALLTNPTYRGIPAFDNHHLYQIDPPGKDPARLVEDIRELSLILHG